MSMVEDHGIEIETPAWLPADGRDVFYFPEPHLGHGHADRVTRVTSRKGRTWYAATSDKGYTVQPDVFVMPGGQRLFIRGVVVDSENPLRWEKVPLDRIAEYRVSPNERFAVFHDHCAVAGYATHGLYWLKRLDYLCAIRFTGIDNRQVFLTAEVDEDIVAECPIALNLLSGSEIYAPKVQ